MGSYSLAQKIGRSETEAAHLIEQHRKTYKKFWAWRDRALEHANVLGYLSTAFGWSVGVDPGYNPRSIGNFPVQGNGAEILRLAVIMAAEANVQIGALIHDAVLIEASVEEIDQKTAVMQDIFTEASKIVLDGFPLRSDAKIVKYPNRFEDEDGAIMWAEILGILRSVEQDPPR